MTLSEFKAWLEGFEEAMGGNPPSADQWRTIKEKLKRVTESGRAGPLEPYTIRRNDRTIPWWTTGPHVAM